MTPTPGRTVLLGPQRFLLTAGTVVQQVAPDGPVAVVNAGWQEREADDGELQEVLGGRGSMLRLFARAAEVVEADPALAEAVVVLRTAQHELSALYERRLAHALDALDDLRRAAARPDVRSSGVADAVRALRDLDTWFLDAVGQLYGELVASGVLERSDVLRRHQEEVERLLADAPVLAVAGGHVGELVRLLRLFRVRPRPEQHVVAWSGGAMAMTERVVLFQDRVGDQDPVGFAGAQVWDRGLRRAPGLVVLPHARRRLRLDDPERVATLVRRFADATCVLLDDGARVEVAGDGALPPGTRVLTPEGAVGVVGEAA
ncbi:hypothetical protein [Lapillicoccus jejuensis]|uniref:Peptidase S51-like protein n=1 Tax=Lapillicoccus jejuensis TaxID=402171 RepID=A0A542E644_9MICO|nr:hypothetical protein [Lapillicoccus jejuensis]TQJ10736.1 hypothetical protein FB458_3872 [Lapillicoccus jejuensis]